MRGATMAEKKTFEVKENVYAIRTAVLLSVLVMIILVAVMGGKELQILFAVVWTILFTLNRVIRICQWGRAGGSSGKMSAAEVIALLLVWPWYSEMKVSSHRVPKRKYSPDDTADERYDIYRRSLKERLGREARYGETMGRTNLIMAVFTGTLMTVSLVLILSWNFVQFTLLLVAMLAFSSFIAVIAMYLFLFSIDHLRGRDDLPDLSDDAASLKAAALKSMAEEADAQAVRNENISNSFYTGSHLSILAISYLITGAFISVHSAFSLVFFFIISAALITATAAVTMIRTGRRIA